jgi:hypothetical protein
MALVLEFSGEVLRKFTNSLSQDNRIQDRYSNKELFEYGATLFIPERKNGSLVQLVTAVLLRRN